MELAKSTGLRHRQAAILPEAHHLQLIAWLRKPEHIHLGVHMGSVAAVRIHSNESRVRLHRVCAHPDNFSVSGKNCGNVILVSIGHRSITRGVIHSAYA